MRRRPLWAECESLLPPSSTGLFCWHARKSTSFSRTKRTSLVPLSRPTRARNLRETQPLLNYNSLLCPAIEVVARAYCSIFAASESTVDPAILTSNRPQQLFNGNNSSYCPMGSHCFVVLDPLHSQNSYLRLQCHLGHRQSRWIDGEKSYWRE